MKRILIKKLNRTLLNKEGTKQVYLTGQEILKLLNISEKEILDGNNSFIAMIKDEFLCKNEPFQYTILVTVGNEIRFSGGDYPKLIKDLKVCECDSLVIESENINNKDILLFSVIKNKNIIIKKYSKNDIEKNEVVNDDYINLYWFWDNNLTDSEMNDFMNEEHFIKYLYKGMIYEKVLKFEKKFVFNKYMNLQVGSVKKQLVEIKELKNDKWENCEFFNDKIINFELIDNFYKASEWKSNCYYNEFK